MPKSNADEVRAARFLSASGLTPERYPESREPAKQKTPDFRVTGPGNTHFLCEVKSVRMDFADGPVLHNTIFNNLIDNLRWAIKQFRSVNRIHSVPNVLLWTSHNFRVNVHTFLDLAHGKILVAGESMADLKKFRYGLVRHEFNDIDLHIWLESDDTPHFVFNGARPDLVAQLTGAFKKWL